MYGFGFATSTVTAEHTTHWYCKAICEQNLGILSQRRIDEQSCSCSLYRPRRKEHVLRNLDNGHLDLTCSPPFASIFVRTNPLPAALAQHPATAELGMAATSTAHLIPWFVQRKIYASTKGCSCAMLCTTLWLQPRPVPAMRCENSPIASFC